MSRKLALPHTRHHLEIFDEDWTFLERLYGPKGSRYGTGPAIRHIVHGKVAAMKAELARLEDLARGAGTGAGAEDGNEE